MGRALPGLQVPLAVDQQITPTLHLQGEAAQASQPDGEIQLRAVVTTAPLVIDEAPAVAASQGFVDAPLHLPLALLEAG